jgi:hypothetical protein
MYGITPCIHNMACTSADARCEAELDFTLVPMVGYVDPVSMKR